LIEKNVKSFLSKVKNSFERFSNKSNIMKNRLQEAREKRIGDFMLNVFMSSSVDRFDQTKMLFLS
jgi:hypothetical protein